MEKKTTGTLTDILKSGGAARLSTYLAEEKDNLFDAKDPFRAWFRERLKQKGFLMQDVFIRADIPERYGYKLISGQKHTNRRDILLRLLIGANLDLREVNQGLRLYGLSELYARIPRDAVLIIGIEGKMDVHGVSALLQSLGFGSLETCGE